MKVIVVGPGEGSVVGKLIAKEFEDAAFARNTMHRLQELELHWGSG